ncbi:LacI family DNA-binding transcriptional regulator [Dactylosporangium sucinum]|uniref:LacI family transcriptional regulator n=1 Tax=Dactylosporangium sucinum TaxID=1424081 RepID=A0A917T0T6_9ACTN|nr:LacI family DNA-binding transcriptional regulator [Dactylosporangium sucinum]GGM05181.1 LacI family transcriptional regulator [Dactylosporangium sucinum]
MARVTSFDVAALAGVSQPTVSRALRNLPGTAPETRERVLRAAAELSYVTSDRGRALSTSSTRRIAVVAAELTNPYYPELVEPLRRELARHGYRTVLVADGDDLTDGSYDGVVLTTTTRHSTLPRDLTERGVPHVLANRLLDHPESPGCAIDNHEGMRVVADLLAGLGHTRIGAVHGPVDTSTGRERADGLRAGLRRHGLHLRRAHVRRVPFSHDAGCVATRELLGLDDPPTAIVCGNDVIAFGALSAARERNVTVPEDLTVIGFDDIPAAGWPLISLTTMRCDLAELARNAVELLLARIAGTAEAFAQRRLPPVLVERTTHARCSGRVE